MAKNELQRLRNIARNMKGKGKTFVCFVFIDFVNFICFIHCSSKKNSHTFSPALGSGVITDTRAHTHTHTRTHTHTHTHTHTEKSICIFFEGAVFVATSSCPLPFLQPVPGVGLLPTEAPDKQHVSRAIAEARRSTASVGKFTDKLPKEKPAKNMGKKRKVVHSELFFSLKSRVLQRC